MPRIKGSLRANIHLLFCRPSSSSHVVDGDGPEVPLQAQSAIAVDAASGPTHSAGGVVEGTQMAEQELLHVPEWSPGNPEATANNELETPTQNEPEAATQNEPYASAQSQPVLSTTVEPTASGAPHTVEEAKARNKEHSRAYKTTMATFNGFTALVKLAEPLLKGTPFQAPAAVWVAIAEGIKKSMDTQDGADRAMDDLSTRMRDIAKYFGDSQNAESRLMLEQYSKELVKDATDTDAILRLPWKGRVNVDANKSKLAKIVEGMNRRTINFHIRIALAIERDTKDILDVLFKNDLRILNRAPRAQYKADTVEGQSKREACTEGTRVDILQRIEDWAGDSSSPSIFWLSGMAGSGKSTIAYTVCQRFSNDDTSKIALGASFFCSRQVPELRRLENIVPTLAYQLSRHSRSFATALKGVDLDVVHVSGEQVDKLLLKPWAVSDGDRSADLPLTLIVIDALDEVDEDRGAELLQGLIDVTRNSMQSRNAPILKILVTSRPHPRIENAGGLLDRQAVYRLESIEKSQGREDILTFLQAKLHDLASEPGNLLEKLADRADGLFIYAATVARILSSTQPSSKMTRIQKLKLLSRFVYSPAASSLSELDVVHKLYQQILEEAIPDHLRDERLPILHRIMCTQQPLPVAALARMLDIDSDDGVDDDAPAVIVEALHAVLYISNVDDCVYVYHKSFSDFMLDRRFSGPNFACDASVQDAGIARACLRIMQESLRFNICNLSSSYLLDVEVPNLAESIQANILNVPGLEYACRHWMIHLRNVPASSEIVQLLCECLSVFVDEKMLFWLEAANLLEATLDITNNLRSISLWVNAIKNVSTKLKSSLATTQCLAQSFFWTKACTSTPHLYISCLATVSGMHFDLPQAWSASFAQVPRISCTGVQSQSGPLIKISVEFPVYSVAFSPDGTRIVSGSRDRSVHIWDALNGSELQTLDLDVRTSGARYVAFFPDNTRLVSGSGNGSVHIWDTSTGVELHKLKVHATSSDVSFALSPDGTRIFSDSVIDPGTIWDAATGVRLHRLIGNHVGVNCVAFSPDGSLIVSGSSDKLLRIWDASTGVKLRTFGEHTSAGYSVAFSPDGTRIVSGSGSHAVYIWNASTGAKMQKLKGHTGNVSSVAFSPDGACIVSGSWDHSVRIWNASTGAELQRFDGHTDLVKSVAFSPDGTRIVSGSDDHFVHIWDASTGTELQGFDGHTNWVSSAAFSPDSTQIVSSSWDRSARIWDTLTGSELQKFEGHASVVYSVAFSPNGTRVASGSYDCSVRIWDALTGTELRKLDGHTKSVSSVGFSPDGRQIVSGSWDHSVRIWNSSTGAELQNLNGHTDGVEAVAFSPDGTRIVSGSIDKSVRVWNALTGAELRKLDEHTGHVQSVVFSPNGRRIVSGSRDGSVRIWDSSSGAELHNLNGHTGNVYSVAFSPDGTHLVSGSHDRSVRIWDALTGAELQKLDGHTSLVTSVAFSPDGTRIVSCSHDKSLRIWDAVASKEHEASRWYLDAETGWVMSVSSDARLLWVPGHLHAGLYDGQKCTLVINQAGRTRVDLSNACLGTDWSGCYRAS